MQKASEKAVFNDTLLEQNAFQVAGGINEESPSLCSSTIEKACIQHAEDVQSVTVLCMHGQDTEEATTETK